MGFSLSVLVCCLHWRYEAKRVPKCFWLCLVLALSLLTFFFSVVRYFDFLNNRCSDSLKFSESASENFWFWLFQKHQRTAGSGFQENFQIRDLLVLGTNLLWFQNYKNNSVLSSFITFPHSPHMLYSSASPKLARQWWT